MNTILLVILVFASIIAGAITESKIHWWAWIEDHVLYQVLFNNK